jgi:hypothetical protein
VNNLPLAGVLVYAKGAQYDFTAMTDQTGHYRMDLIAGSYDMTAGSFTAGFSGSDSTDGVVVNPYTSTPQDFEVTPIQ